MFIWVLLVLKTAQSVIYIGQIEGDVVYDGSIAKWKSL